MWWIGPMQVDLIAGTRYEAGARSPVAAPPMPLAPTILVFDSGLGGLTVFTEVERLRPDAGYVYAADDAGFPYGRLSEAALVARVNAVMGQLVADFEPDAVVVACNTASTLVLPHLRAAFPDLPFIGTVPAIKPAAQQSRSRLISVLGTPGTVARDYTRELVRSYAGGCAVTLVGAEHLAGLAEAAMKGEAISDAAVAPELAPCFVEAANRARTDCVVLACTHYPLLLPWFERLAPWPVHWLDPAEAIARRVDHVLEERGFAAPAPGARAAPRRSVAVFTSRLAQSPALVAALDARGLAIPATEPAPTSVV
jgi:glutamate racemase